MIIFGSALSAFTQKQHNLRAQFEFHSLLVVVIAPHFIQTQKMVAGMVEPKVSTVMKMTMRVNQMDGWSLSALPLKLPPFVATCVH